MPGKVADRGGVGAGFETVYDDHADIGSVMVECYIGLGAQ